MARRQRILVVASKAAYQTADFVAAAERLGVDVQLATDRCRTLAEAWAEGAWAVDLTKPEAAASDIVRRAQAEPVNGIVGTDEATVVVAAIAAERLGLRHNPARAARIAGNKLAFRRALHAAGLLQPAFRDVPVGGELDFDVEFPVVVKPLHLSASRGVMRADDAGQLAEQVARLGRLLAEPDVRRKDPGAARSFVIESFVPGAEVALEALLEGGALRALAVFDKPDPLDGPFFAETIYVTPSCASAAVQRSVERAVADAASAIGLREGPVHAEVRLSPSGPVVLELAARTIGGLCSRTLRFGAGLSLEAVVIAHALGRDPVELLRAGPPAAGVLMIPVPAPGVVRGIDGADTARAFESIEDVVITARVGDIVAPLPEGHTYMGFVFAAAADPGSAVAALRRAGDEIRFRIAPLL